MAATPTPCITAKGGGNLKQERKKEERERERERGAKWHQNPQLDTACALPVQARQVHLKVSRSGGHGMHIVSESSSG